MRLIDADNLRDIFKYETCLFEPNDVLDYIDSECTIHAVEVVHCKNCRYWDGYNHSGRCEAPVNGLVRENTSANDFCSYGERKGDVESDGMDQRKR